MLQFLGKKSPDPRHQRSSPGPLEVSRPHSFCNGRPLHTQYCLHLLYYCYYGM